MDSGWFLEPGGLLVRRWVLGWVSVFFSKAQLDGV